MQNLIYNEKNTVYCVGINADKHIIKKVTEDSVVVKNKRSIMWITSAFLVLQAAMMIVLADRGRMDYVWSITVSTCFWLFYTFLEVRYCLRMSTYVRILMVLAIFFDAFFGYCFNLYENSAVFDKLMHVFGTYAFSLFAYILVMQMQTAAINRPVKFILVLCLGLSLGVVYEIFEFIGDNVSHPVPPNQPSLWDTDIDLIGDLIGASLAAFHAVFKKNIDE